MCYYFLPSVYLIYSPMQKNKLQTLKMYLFNLYIYVDAILNFQKYLWKILVKHPNTNSELNRSLFQVTIKTTLSDCTSHEIEAILNYCTIYKLTCISIQPLCPVCLLVIG